MQILRGSFRVHNYHVGFAHLRKSCDLLFVEEHGVVADD